MGFFLKFISWSRRIVLRQFENGPSSLKRKKGAGKIWRSYKFEVILLSGRCITLEVRVTNMKKSKWKKFQHKISSRKKNFFSIFFFWHQTLYLSFKMHYWTWPTDHSPKNGTPKHSQTPPSEPSSNHRLHMYSWIIPDKGNQFACRLR